MPETLVVFALKCFYFMLPAYFANMAPVIARKINFLAYPVDFGLTIGNKPVLGKNKTFRGLFFGVIFAVTISYLQFNLHNSQVFGNISFYNYQNWVIFGFLMGFGALVGDLVKSFFKRRFDIKPGDKFVPFDQIDFVIGSLAFVTPIFILSPRVLITILLLSFVLDIIVNHIAFFLKVRNEKW